MSIFHYEDKTQDLISAISFMVYIPNAAPYYMDINHGIYPVRWTLNYEFYFYITFSICLLFKYRFAILSIWCLLSVVVIPMLYGNTPTLETSGYEVQTALYGLLSNPLIIEFLIGVVTALLYIRVKSLNIENASFFISLALLSYICYVISTGVQHGINVKIALPIGFFVLFLTLAENKIKIFIPNFLLWLGDISFSLYLIHLPLGFAFFECVEKADNALMVGIPYALIAICLSLILAHFSHKYIEIQLSCWLKRKIFSA
ncbi:MAG: acyltransferase family protein [Sodalis sp. (in: enterobacteria)]|uniref:acyltransferase family protein n=1 Tax=Sodalis sp. (in: enterobacteria) TaxID=1898979 RepID=UPI0039E59827